MNLLPRVFAIDPRRTLRDLSLGFLYWLGFVLVLEPGNLMRWAPSDVAGWAHEGFRLVAAGLLGGAATPAILALTRRLPIEGPHAVRRAAIHFVAGLGMTLSLILASCLLARLALAAHRPLLGDVTEELIANGSLVAAWIAGLTALAHAARAMRHDGAIAQREPGVAIHQRGRFDRIELAEIEWIETQGNYLALHGPAGTRLLRQTAKTFEARLDPSRFVRIHRRIIVAVNAVQSIAPLPAGDARLRLKTGQELRVSRSRRGRLWSAMEGLETL